MQFFATGEKMRLMNSTGNLLIGTTTDSGYKLDVNGTARVQGNAQISSIYLGTSNNVRLGDLSGVMDLNGYSGFSLKTWAAGWGSGNAALTVSSTGYIGIGQATPSASLHISGASSAALLKIDSPAVNNILYVSGSGRVGIGTNNPQGAIHIAVSSSTPALVLSDVGSPDTIPTLQFRRGPLSAYSLQIDYPSNNKARFQIGDAVTGYEFTGGPIGLTGGRSIEFGGITGQTATAVLGSVHTDNNNGQLLFSTRGSGTLSERMRIFSTGNVLIGTTTDSGYKLDVNGIAIIRGLLEIQNNNGLRLRATGGGASTSFRSSGNSAEIRTNDASVACMFFNQNGVVGFSQPVAFGNTVVSSPSALVQIDSTTKGFLPPRMTGAQAEAISSPAEGLMVYATDGTGVTITSKGWWGYDGATWVKFN
jgi:hypothetical protein